MRHAASRRIEADPRTSCGGRLPDRSHCADRDCPIIHDRTTISITPLPDGVTLHVTTDLPHHVKDVQDQTAQRLATLPRWLPR